MCCVQPAAAVASSFRDMGQADVEGFLTMLTTEREVAPATHRQALNAQLFLYRQVLGRNCPGCNRLIARLSACA